jgi:hypothetical protein
VDVGVVRFHDPEGIRVEDFATLGYVPLEEDVQTLDAETRAAFMLCIAGGVAGNKFAGVTTIESGADADRKALARLTSQTLEEISDLAVAIINKHRRTFRQLISLIRIRYVNLITKNRDIETGRHILVTEGELEKLFSEYVKPLAKRA